LLLSVGYAAIGGTSVLAGAAWSTRHALGARPPTDIMVDGVLIGLSATIGSGTGLLFATALAPEMGLLGITAAQSLARRWDRRRIVTAAAVVGVSITGAGALSWTVARAGGAAVAAVLGVGAGGRADAAPLPRRVPATAGCPPSWRP
ncbi:MAG: hypothetical protein ACRDYZ_04580, partial [Acidimicrobiales bacterium]